MDPSLDTASKDVLAVSEEEQLGTAEIESMEIHIPTGTHNEKSQRGGATEAEGLVTVTFDVGSGSSVRDVGTPGSSVLSAAPNPCQSEEASEAQLMLQKMEVVENLLERDGSGLGETNSDSVPSLGLSESSYGISLDEQLPSSNLALDANGDPTVSAVPSRGDSALCVGATAAVPDPGPVLPLYYYIKWITWKEKKTPIITQSENGPCPLLAIMNILFLRWKAQLPPQTEVITTEDLMAHLGECVLSIKPREKAQGMELNFQQNMNDAMAVLPKLSTGLDVNVRFTGVTDFEYTPECIVFDLLNIPLYHGWLVDPQSPEMVSAVGKLSYNQLVEKIIDYKQSTDSRRVSQALVAEQFLESTATQLSYHGLCELNTTVKEGELSVFFRNNHFSTMIKHKDHLYLLVTDQGFLQEDSVVWESLHNVEGDGNFCDSEFRLCHPPQRMLAPNKSTAQQIDQDYLVAMSLQQQQTDMSDLELARQLQQAEYEHPGQQQQGVLQPSAQQTRGQLAGPHGGQRRRGDKKEDSDCAIL